MVKNYFSFSKLKKNQVKALIFYLETSYGTTLEELKKFHFYSTPKGKVYLSTIDINEHNFQNINSLGLYFGTYHDEQRFRLSIEGTLIVGLPKFNYILIAELKTFESYLSGENLFLEEVKEIISNGTPDFYIVVYKEKCLGCVSLKNNEILTYIPKSRAINFNKIF